MSIYEYNEEEHMRMEREEFFEEGLKEGQKRERQNTEKERQRADIAEKEIVRLKENQEQERQRAESAEAEAARWKAELEKLKTCVPHSRYLSDELGTQISYNKNQNICLPK